MNEKPNQENIQNDPRNNEPVALFENNKDITLQLLRNHANRLTFDSRNQFEYPSILLKYIYEYTIQWDISDTNSMQNSGSIEIQENGL